MKNSLAKVDENNFRILYESYHQRIYSFAYSLTNSRILAEEVTQEIFIKIWEYRSELDKIRQFDAWLTIIVRNQCYTYLNRFAKEQLVIQDINRDEQKSINTPEEKLIYNEYSILYRKILDNLPNQQRKVFIMSRQEGIKYDQIALHMGLSINTIKSHMKAALKKIKAELKNLS